jgi:hypothetical protein
MTRKDRVSSRQESTLSEQAESSGTGGFLGQVGLFEAANGLPHGPAAIALAVMAALVIYPVGRILGAIRRH